jgi:hypothetical protein
MIHLTLSYHFSTVSSTPIQSGEPQPPARHEEAEDVPPLSDANSTESSYAATATPLLHTGLKASGPRFKYSLWAAPPAGTHHVWEDSFLEAAMVKSGKGYRCILKDCKASGYRGDAGSVAAHTRNSHNGETDIIKAAIEARIAGRDVLADISNTRLGIVVLLFCYQRSC